MDWLNVRAMAVNEENAPGGRVVTAPTNGAAGIIPSVATTTTLSKWDGQGIQRYFLGATAIRDLYRDSASMGDPVRQSERKS